MTNKVLKKTILKLEGMSCAACAQAIEKALKNADGVGEARVNFAAEKAYLEFDPSLTNEEKLADAVRAAGYDVKVRKEKVTIKIGGMTCASCSAAVERALNRAEGIYQASVNIATERAVVEYDPERISREELREIIKNTGYELLGFEGDETTETGINTDLKKLEEARKKMWGSWAFTLPIIFWMIPEMVFGIVWPNMTVYNI
ncbi:MAG: heavy-metal-associated domain-containing protein, partial [Halanaerobiaceae bacterium]|nr:heavy-metal-associated domain-containing protein [Halanaerobiaceae bacterium]